MTEFKKPSEIIAMEGQELDHEQNLRLNFANDPVYAHLATLATAGAINGIEWEMTEKRGEPKLLAVQHRPDKGDKRLGRKLQKLPEEISTVLETEANVVIRGRLAFSQSLISRHFRLNHGIDRSLTRSGFRLPGIAQPPNQLESSTIMLERASKVYGNPPLLLGIIAVHASHFSDDTGVGVTNNLPESQEIQDLISIIQKPVEEPDIANELLRNIRTMLPQHTELITQPTAHFAFHEALGVPAKTVDLARQNFSILSGYMELPYTLPEAAE